MTTVYAVVKLGDGYSTENELISIFSTRELAEDAAVRLVEEECEYREKKFSYSIAMGYSLPDPDTRYDVQERTLDQHVGYMTHQCR